MSVKPFLEGLSISPGLAVVDIETTGMSVTSERITEIAILTVINGKVVEEWSTLVDPECSIPPEIRSLTGITNAMVQDAPTFSQIADEVLHRLQGKIFVAHNARFDYGFIKNELRRLERPFTADVLCTVRLSRKLYSSERSHSLDALRERHHLTAHGRHRALGDARAAWQFIETAMREHQAEDITKAVKTLLKMPSLPPQLAAGVLDDLPEGPGVYLFHGVNDLPIYIGKGTDIRSRVRSHFSSDYRSANDQRLSVEITRITFEETAGELGALLREAQLVKQLMPLRNHRLRRNQEVAFIRLADLKTLPEYLRANEVDLRDSVGLYGPFATKNQAKSLLQSLAPEHGLCWHAIGTNRVSKKTTNAVSATANGSCFARQLKRCHGYCVGLESMSQHNLRLAAALTPYRLESWPSCGAISLKEIHVQHGWQHYHVFDRWTYLGSAKNETELDDLNEKVRRNVVIEFDPDIYKILVKQFARKVSVQKLKLSSSTTMKIPDEENRDASFRLNVTKHV